MRVSRAYQPKRLNIRWLVAALFVLVAFVSPKHAQAQQFLPELIWVELGAGYSSTKVNAHRYDNLFPNDYAMHDWGPSFGAAAGVNLWLFKPGIRYLGSSHGDYGLNTLLGELNFQTPTLLWIFRAHFGLGAGYSWMTFNENRANDLSVGGFTGEARIGLDVFVTDWLSIGPALSLNIMRLTRDATYSQTLPELLTPGDTWATRFNIEALRVTGYFLKP